MVWCDAVCIIDMHGSSIRLVRIDLNGKPNLCSSGRRLTPLTDSDTNSMKRRHDEGAARDRNARNNAADNKSAVWLDLLALFQHNNPNKVREWRRLLWR